MENKQRTMDIEEQQKKLIELEIENKVKHQIMKKMEAKKERTSKVDAKLTNQDVSIPNSNTAKFTRTSKTEILKRNSEQGGRRSFDMTRHRLTHRKDAMFSSSRTRQASRRSLDASRPTYHGSTSPPMSPSVEQNINKAALLAWSQHSNENLNQTKPKPAISIKQKKSKSSTDVKEVAKRSESQSKVDNSRIRLARSHSSRVPSDSRKKTEEKGKLEKQSKPPVVQTKSRTKTSPSSPLIKGRSRESQTSDPDTLEESQDETTSFEGIDPVVVEQIKSNILDMDDEIHWDDVAGLTTVKASLKEAVVYPFLRPDLFKGLREPIRGMLLFGPPGTGKTMIAKAIATESKSTFFSISASSLLSKYLGESEKLVKALFMMARQMAPSIIFIDEIDSILGNRSDNENESSRRIKTELLIQWSGLSKAAVNESSSTDQRVLVLAATNLPWVIDDAARRRFSRRLYVPLPDDETRLYHLKRLLSHQVNTLSEDDLADIVRLTEGYSGSDLTALAKEAAMEPIRELGDKLMHVDFNNIRHVEKRDFITAMESVKKSVSQDSLARFDEWAREYGSMGS